MSWRKLFPLIFLFTCVDGFISNLFYPSRLTFLYKDILILIVYFLFMVQESRRHWVGKFKRSIGHGVWYIAMLFILLGIAQIFNPEIPNILVGIMGFKVIFFYWPLAILGYAYIDSPDRLRNLLRVIIYFSIPICLFGLYQFWADPYFMIERFGSGFERAMTMAAIDTPGVASFLRVYGTFASTGQFSMFLFINHMFIFALLFTAKNKFERRLMIGYALLNFITMLATGSRGGLVLIFMSSIIFLFFCRHLWRRLFLSFILGMCIYLGFTYLGKSVIARFETLKDPEFVRWRTVWMTSVTFTYYFEKYPLGRGLGTGSGASRHLTKEGEGEGEDTWVLIENYPAKLQYETGILGVIIFYLLLIGLSIHWIKHWLKPKPIHVQAYILITALSSIALSSFVYSLYGVMDTPPQSIFLWAIVGMAAKTQAIQSDDKYLIST